MTRAVFMSDIHGNLAALQAVASRLPRSDAVIVAGDLCLEGPRPEEVVDFLRESGWLLLTGNTDREIVAPHTAKPRKQALLAWTRERLGSGRIDLLASLPFEQHVAVDGCTLALAVHANPLDVSHHLRPEMTTQELDPYLAGVDAEMILFGHLHTPYVRPVGKHLLVDVAAVGRPQDGDRRAVFVAVEWSGEGRTISQVRVPYDVEAVAAEIQASGMPGAGESAEELLRATY